MSPRENVRLRTTEVHQSKGELRMGLGTTASTLTLGGTQTIGGSGAIVFGDNTSNSITTDATDYIVTFGSNLTLRGKSGQFAWSGATVSYVFRGLVQPDVAGGMPTITGSTVLYQGRIEPLNGAAITLTGNWSNTGTIKVTNSTTTLAGSFTQFGLGSASPVVGQGTSTRSGGTVNLTGIVTGDLTLNAANFVRL